MQQNLVTKYLEMQWTRTNGTCFIIKIKFISKKLSNENERIAQMSKKSNGMCNMNGTFITVTMLN